MLRVIIAFLAAPFLAWLSRGVIFSPSGAHLAVPELAGAALRAAIPIYLFALPLGFALFTVAWKLRRLGWLSAALAGAAVALVFFAPPTLHILFDDKLNTWYKSKVLLESSYELLFGAWVGVLAWVLGVWRNPALWVRHSHRTGSAQSAP